MPIKVEPKVYFANERTFLAWLHTSVILAAASVSIVAFADQNPYSQMYGIMLLPVSIAFIIYALRQCTYLQYLEFFTAGLLCLMNSKTKLLPTHSLFRYSQS